jgi:hypothetical protein
MELDIARVHPFLVLMMIIQGGRVFLVGNLYGEDQHHQLNQ